MQATCIGQRHTLVSGDTCPSVAAEYNMTVAQLKALNPALRDCAYLSQLATLCIGALNPVTCTMHPTLKASLASVSVESASSTSH